jgi:hypothetical protein
MASLRRSTELAATASAPVLLAADGGAPANALRDRDPFEALDDLMVVVEALCPTWPPRRGFGSMPDMRL